MKKIYLLAVPAFFAALSSLAQRSPLKPFKVDYSGGPAIPNGPGTKFGFLAALEPKFAVKNNLSVGICFAEAVMARFRGYDQNGRPVNGGLQGSISYLATTDYYFKQDYLLRPFVGAGIGASQVESVVTSNGNTASEDVFKFGGLIRAGIESGHLRFGIEYNIIPKSLINGNDGNGNPAIVSSPNSYIGVKVGVCFGGGRRSK